MTPTPAAPQHTRQGGAPHTNACLRREAASRPCFCKRSAPPGDRADFPGGAARGRTPRRAGFTSPHQIHRFSSPGQLAACACPAHTHARPPGSVQPPPQPMRSHPRPRPSSLATRDSRGEQQQEEAFEAAAMGRRSGCLHPLCSCENTRVPHNHSPRDPGSSPWVGETHPPSAPAHALERPLSPWGQTHPGDVCPASLGPQR